jgi:hypothetical protein
LLVNVLFIFMSYKLQYIGNFKLVVLILVIALPITQILHLLAKRRNKLMNP